MSEIVSLDCFQNKRPLESYSFSDWGIHFFFPLPPLGGWAHDPRDQWSPAQEYASAPKKTIKRSDWHWRMLLVKRMSLQPSPVTLIPLQWCPRSQRAPEQWPRGLWWHWTPRRSRGKRQAGAQFKKTVRSVKWAKQQSVPGSQKAGKCPYRPNRPGKSWHLKKENLW